jgi:predicted nucleic acid-binding protein
MKSSRVVEADTTPLNYLIIIDRSDLLRQMFGEVLIPRAVLDELQHPKAPVAVAAWLKQPPSWLRVVEVQHLDDSIRLGRGENEAISLAVEHEVQIILMDERRGRAAAAERGLLPVGTLNLLDLADEKGLCEGLEALEELRRTTFRAEPELLAQFEARMRERRHSPSKRTSSES